MLGFNFGFSVSPAVALYHHHHHHHHHYYYYYYHQPFKILIIFQCISVLERTKKDLEAMKAQSEGLHKEYDRLLDENERLEVRKMSEVSVLA